MKNSILLVDDEPNVLAALQRALVDEPLDTRTAQSGEEGVAALRSQTFKIVISDERMPGMDGAEFLSIVRERFPETVRMMLTGHASIEATMRAVNSGEIYRFFTKPWNEIELKLAIRSAIEKYDLEAENRRLLKTVRHQAVEFKVLEKRYPGITRLEKDDNGNVIMPDMQEDELAQIIEECNREYR
ncbi:MAG: response regulator [Geobacteraceae bacterium]|nr:MAG: response regulator [Geobacteraceae bacterium]